MLYRVLPHARLRRREVAAGAALAAALFLLRRYGIGYYLRTTDLGGAYGGAGALAVLLVRVYYASLVLYVGAEFSRCYARRHGGSVRVGRYAEVVQIVPVARTNGQGQADEYHQNPTTPDRQFRAYYRRFGINLTGRPALGNARKK